MTKLPAEISETLAGQKLVHDFKTLKGRIGLFGGSFDPLHSEHLSIARELIQAKLVNHVVFIPAAQNPLKTIKPTSDSDRLAMILLAIEKIPCLYVSTVELDRGALSYTVETLRSIQGMKDPGAELFWIIGSDNLATLGKWSEVDEIFKLARLITVQRDEVRSLTQWHEYIRSLGLSGSVTADLIAGFVERKPNTVSSTAIRNRMVQSKHSQELPDEVVAYIQRHRLYR